jgi:multidrug efflux pump subunit AcrA (membrane-fusion protein)
MKMNHFINGLGLLLAATAIAVPTKDKPTVQIEKVKAVELFDVMTYPARLVPKVNASVLSEIDGMVVKISQPLGASVNRGQEILTMKNTDPGYDYATVALRAPVKGIVSSVEVTDGSRVTKGQKLATVTDPTQIRILIEIASSDLPFIRKGMLGELKVSTEEQKLPVQVTGVSPFVDPATGTASAELTWSRNHPRTAKLPPGLSGTVSFRTEERKGFQLPEQAIVYRGDQTLVRIVDNGKAKYRPVTLGPIRRGLVEVVKGLEEGIKVIVRSSTYVSDDEEITIENDIDKPSGEKRS